MKISGMEAMQVSEFPKGKCQQHGLSWHMAWRRALEQAHWEVRPRHQSLDQHHTRPTLPSAATTLVPSAHQTLIQDVAKSSIGAMPQALVDRDIAPSRGTAPRSLAPRLAPEVGSDINAMASGQMMRERLPRTGQAVEVSSAATPLTLAQHPEWWPRSLHLNLQGKDVRASVRDAELEPHQILQLTQRLRSYLQSLDLELVELLVNGHSAQLENVTTLEGDTAWRLI